MRSVLVTGGAGFIGANFVHYWRRRHPDDRVVVLDALTAAGNLASLADVLGGPNVLFVRGDICDQPLVEDLLRTHDISTVVHFAAESHVDRSIHGPDPFVATNVVGTHSLLKATRQVWLEEAHGAADPRFHHVSTDEVYGSLGPDDPPFDERSPYAPNSPYAATKAAADHLVRAYHRTFGLPVSVSHCGNNYGPFQFPEKLIPLMLVRALDGAPLPVYGDGLHVRDWLHVSDHCRAIERVLEAGAVGETYDFGGRSERRNLDVVRALCRALDMSFDADRSLGRRFPRCPAAHGQPCDLLITFVADRPGHDRRYAIDGSKAACDLGFVPAVNFDEGLSQTVAWYLTHEVWWRAVMDGSYRTWLNRQYGSLAGPTPPVTDV
jgi:dTDP-glucose 4,6-dehydratase